ncbi:MAG: response regulator [Phycisphaerae bacterium]
MRQILVADDDPVYQDLLRDLLEEWGYETIVVGDGEAAWDMLQRDSAPKLVILDWMMPGVDGFEICRRLRADNQKQDVYVLLLTASRMEDEIIKVLVAGADDFLLKPFQPLELKIHLRAANRILDLQEELYSERQERGRSCQRRA